MIPDWYPGHPPLYDIEKSYLENAEQGPFFDGPIPKRGKIDQKFDLFGHSINSPLGVPAGPLLNSRWIALAAKLGFDVPTYKTIRSHAHPGHPLPNVVYVKTKDAHHAVKIDAPSPNLSEFTITNSFGMPSRSPEYLLEDIEKANRSLNAGQVMIVSVVGSPLPNRGFLDDFVYAASLAKDAGAKLIEANFSCPNVEKTGGCLYMSPDTVFEYAKKISEAIHPIPLLIKVGLFPNHPLMKSVLTAAARGGVRGICGLNAVSMEVADPHGRSALGEHRKTSGVCGGAIRPQALSFIRAASEIIREDRLGLVLLGCGGITLPEHFDEFFHAGAKIALAATGMMWDPYLALRHTQRNEHAASLAHP